METTRLPLGVRPMGAEETQLLEGLSSFAATLTRPAGISDVLHDLAVSITQVLQVLGAGVTLVHEGRVVFVTSPFSAITALEESQETTQSGPCVVAARTGSPVVIRDLHAPEALVRWPEYVATARAVGVRAVAGIPLVARDEAIGALNVYASEVRDWGQEELRTARTFADLATGYLVHTSEVEEQRRLSEQLQHALDSRIVIEQAKGILAEARGCTVDEAFAVLRAHAREHNAKLRDVARAVIELGLRP
jgi:GAF domain-containing protein